ncbi:hypothetical protein ACUXCC_005396 [Cytobacillus horneckiae]|uniref:hypothetical protein n=1 Tax=Cytobacillus horneckiae TaxID=549687 RepID=UPI0019D17CD6|nr:hypothetical protein [Cytobacillus horneckiae]MBN6887460.1 hypothetical protein [Cytobacillus horneckiae]
MSKLDPRPKPGSLYSWEELNNILKARFNRPGEGSAAIDLRQFSISKDEIKSEAEKQGYKVFEEGDYHLIFK